MIEIIKRILLRFAITYLSSKIDKFNKKIDKAQDKLNKKLTKHNEIINDDVWSDL